MWLLTGLAFALVLRRGQGRAGAAVKDGARGFVRILPLIACGLIAAGFMAELVPEDLATDRLGPDSGLMGHLVATAIGAVLPGGPFVTFPIALAFVKAGAGPAQMVTLITSWSVLGLNRVLVWEWPTLGARFVAARMITGIFLPPMAGLATEALILLLALDPSVAMMRPR